MEEVDERGVEVAAHELDSAVVHDALYDAPEEDGEPFGGEDACVDVAGRDLQENLVATVFPQLCDHGEDGLGEEDGCRVRQVR